MEPRLFTSTKVIIVLFCFLPIFSYAQFSEFGEAVNRIVGGRDSYAGEFPHHVSLQISSHHICGGAIIGRKWILTAAHCALAGDLVVIAGKYNIEEPEDTEQIRDVEDVFVHHLYSGSLKPYDIAVLKLSKPFRFNEYVSAIDLPSPGSEPPRSAVLSGWGSISRTDDRELPAYLQAATMPVIDLDECREMFAEVTPDSPFELDEANLCTGPGYNRLASCSGDSGGPLIANGKVIGITSWGAIPCDGRSPSAFGKVSYFTNWIKDIVYNK